MSKDIPVVLIVGKQNAGKTTLLELIIPLLKKEGYRVGTIKYNIPSFDIDYEGKDTYKYYQAGADIVSISSQEKMATIKRIGRKQVSIEDIIADSCQNIDIVLVEGYKKWQYPYIEIHTDRESVKSRQKNKEHLDILRTTKPDKQKPIFHERDVRHAIEFITSKIP
ncbi:MAG: molybdopterin-guanine dinucleotide biosynthesis protein B [Candidatus Brocadiaceae bacterium]|nr:molybdopterin-guanine dinucleotide biosynthesis protein B [Candidatus Brocadiaceae bacterium]